MINDSVSTDDSAGRRQFLRALAAAGLSATVWTSATAATAPGASAIPSQPAPIPPGTLGAASAGADRPKIAMLVHPKMVLQDLVGPLTVFNVLRCEIHLVWKNREPVMTEVGLPVTPTTLFGDCPDGLDVLFAPGGLEGTIALMGDPEVLGFIANRGQTARYVTSACTGSLLLGAAGLLRGYQATSHWSVRDQLALLGSTPVHERVVQDRNRITSGGVTAGIDFGLTLAALLRTRTDAEIAQLLIEYAPAPPFNAGTPETAPRPVYERVAALRAETVERARQAAIRAAATFPRPALA